MPLICFLQSMRRILAGGELPTNLPVIEGGIPPGIAGRQNAAARHLISCAFLQASAGTRLASA
jgi:hypothetical protein